MTEIKLVKKYPNIRDEDVIEIFQEGYLKGFENGRKKAIPIEWIEKWLDKTTGTRDGGDISQLPEQLKFAIGMINLMEMEWEKENQSLE